MPLGGKTDRIGDMKTLTMALGERSYPIYIGSGLLAQPDLLLRHIPGQQVLVVTNETVAPLYLDRVMDTLSGLQRESLVLPDGEQFKTQETVNQVFDALLKKRFNRTATLVALGGGVIGDITGFAAACYQRGIHFIQVPTTLLAQVDSSVGGKTGVNHPLGKNMIGAFYQPRCVIADTETLNTLEDRELSAGTAEVVKYGLIRDLPFYDWLKENAERLLERDADALAYAIERSCQNKAEVVADDERESGQRALLNLGHTFGHAIETGAGYGTWLHGEAVAIGMYMAAELSARLGWLNRTDVEQIEALLKRLRLPVRPPQGLGTARFLELMAVDKKVLDGRLRLVLLKAIGQAVVTDDFDLDRLQAMLEQLTEDAAA